MMRWIVIVAVGIVVAVAVWASLKSSRPVEAARVRSGTISAWIEEQARTRLPRTYRITMPIPGRIMPIDLVEGDRVESGQVVAELETADLDTAVEMAEARVLGLEASIIENNDTRLELSTIAELDSFLESVDTAVDASRAETEASEARQDYRIFDHDRKKKAFQENAAALREVEEAQLAEIESRVDYRTDVLYLRGLEAIRRAVQIWPLQVRQMIEKKALKEAVLRHDLAEARAALAQAVRDRKRAEITSPVDGVVLRRFVADRRVLPAGEPLLEIGRMEELEVEVEVLSEEAVAVAAGDVVEITVPASGHEPLRGTVSRIEPRGFTKVSSLGVEQQRVLVLVAFDPRDLASFLEAGHSLGVGYRLRVRIHTDARDSAVILPRSALFRGSGDRWNAFVIRNGHARLADLEIGLTNEAEVEVKRGLAEGDQVILAPETDLEDGERVQTRP